MLFSGGMMNQRYYKETYVDKFGTTEDISLGGILVATLGLEERDFSERWYTGVNGVLSKRIQNVGYFSWKLGWGGFRNFNRWEQNVFNLNLIYHSTLRKSDDWKFRWFLRSDFLLGYNRFQGEQIYLDNFNGLRGIPRFSLSGTKRLTINIENRIFSPFDPLGFVLGGIVFADFGIITSKDVNLDKQKLYQSYGIGIRTRNESIAGAKFQISLAYNPVLPPGDKSHLKIIFGATFVMGNRGFGIGQPDIIGFNGE